MSKATTIEKDNRFYEQPNGEMLTENEQLKEWLKIANESNDYFREENVRLINEEKELLREIHNKINEIERLNKIINKIIEFLQREQIEKGEYSDFLIENKQIKVQDVLDKLQELKGDGSNEL